MDLEKLWYTRNVLFQHMLDSGYSTDYIKHLEWEIKWLRKNQEKYKFQSFNEAYEIRLASGRKKESSQNRIYGLRSRFTAIQAFAEKQEFPNRHKKVPLIKKASYWKLNPKYKDVLDQFKLYAQQYGYANTTIRKCISKSSCFFLHLQEKGHPFFDSVKEMDVLSFFTNDEGQLAKSRSYKRDIETVLSAELEEYQPEMQRICDYLPAIKKHRKNIQYFTKDEADSIRSVLENEETNLSKRDIAIGALLFYTGLRASDIAYLRDDEIDWDNERIRKIQSKTDNYVDIPLSIAVGNAIYDYIANERPPVENPYVFLWEKPNYHPIDPTVIWPTTAKIFKEANIRQKPGDRRGSHIFRHHLATHLAEKGVPQPVISEILGHEAPVSLDYYLSSDIEHLRQCALSIDMFPVREGALQL